MYKTLSDDSDWADLLDSIEERRLTPVIGKELYKYKEKDSLVPIEDYLAQKILEIFKVTDQQPAGLPNAVNFLLNEKKIESMDIIKKLKFIVRDISFDFPLLNELLSIQELQYFVNTAVYNNLLETQLSKLRRQPVTSINFSIKEPFSDAADLNNLKAPFVFNVFGSLLNTTNPALTEDDMLEYTGFFKERINASVNILNALKNKNLLFIGCAFPNWMVRFMLRLLSNEPMYEWGKNRSVFIVNDNTELRAAQFAFLKNYRVITYDGNTENFIHEFSERWKKRKPNMPKTKNVFLSYTIKDRSAVEALKTAIESIENVKCWYDDHEINPGDEFATLIALNIKSADLFIPLISANSLNHKDGYVQREWITADNENIYRKNIQGITDNYLVPVIIDDTNSYDSSIPECFSSLSTTRIPQGNARTDFIKHLKEILRLT